MKIKLNPMSESELLKNEMNLWLETIDDDIINKDVKRCSLLLDRLDNDVYCELEGKSKENDEYNATCKKLHTYLNKNDSEIIEKSNELYQDFIKNLKPKDSLEVFDLQYGQKFYPCKILNRKKQVINVSFNGFSSKYDAEIDLSVVRVLPAKTTQMVNKMRKTFAEIRKNELLGIKNDDDDNHDNATHRMNTSMIRDDQNNDRGFTLGFLPKTEVVGASLSGRAIKMTESAVRLKKEAQDASAKRKLSLKSKKKKKADINESNGDIGDDEEDYNDWLCSICRQFHAPDKKPLLLCDGGCMRSFHLGCLGVSENELKKGAWYCEECQNNAHSCTICGEVGKDNDLDGVWKCNQKHCGCYFHINCLERGDNYFEIYEKTVFDTNNICPEINTIPNGNMNGSVEKVIPVIKCPKHFCGTCHEYYTKGLGRTTSRPSDKSPGHLMACVGDRCALAFHRQCVPPGTRMDLLTPSEPVLLCPAHETQLMPNRDDSFFPESKSGTMGAIWDGLILALPQVNPRPNVNSDHHYRLTLSLQTNVESHPPDYQSITRLDYDFLPNGEKTLPISNSQVCCECVDKCGADCLNRLMKIECSELPKNQGGSNCAVGGSCGNRCFKNKEYVKMQPIQEEGMGWGCKVCQDVSKGALVIEYIGEVIDIEEMQRRNVHQRQHNPHDRDFYVMELENGYFVDGKRKGNLSRFINHSCDPNCELIRWEVKGRTRIGIFAKKDIKNGEVLSYDYHFETNEEESFKCACRSFNCRGTMAPSKKDRTLTEVGNLSKKQKLKFIASGRQSAKISTKNAPQRELERCLTGRFLPGRYGIDEMKDGPKCKDYNAARDLKLYLPRNNKRGMDLLIRKEIFMKNGKKRKLQG